MSDHVHIVSVFGSWCYLCGHRKRWWKVWEKVDGRGTR